MVCVLSLAEVKVSHENVGFGVVLDEVSQGVQEMVLRMCRSVNIGDDQVIGGNGGDLESVVCGVI